MTRKVCLLCIKATDTHVCVRQTVTVYEKHLLEWDA